MSNTTIKKLFIKSLVSFLAFGGAIHFLARNISTLPRAVEYRDCSFYFDDRNGYASIYEINQDLINDSVDTYYKTWGTVTTTFETSSNYFNFYVQSTDKFGYTSGIYVYQSTRTDISVGNVVTIIGAVQTYNNLPEFVAPTIAVDQQTNEFPVEPFLTTAAYWRNSTNPTSSEFITAQAMGSRQLRINGGLINYVSSGNATFSVADVVIPLTYGSTLNTSAIDNKISKLNNKTVDVIGQLHCYKSGSTTRMQLFISKVSEIISSEVIGESLVLDSTSGYKIGSYSTGNYETVSLSSVGYEHYRGLRSSGNLIALLPYESDIDNEGVSGAFYNITSLGEIVSMIIHYATDFSAVTKPTLSLGETPISMVHYELPLSTSVTTYALTNISASYFRLETSAATLTIKKIEMIISDFDLNQTFSYLETQNKRINPVVFEEELFEGATVTVPIDGYYSGSTFYVTEEKELTYYSYEYVNANRTLASAASYTDIKEIAAYYVAFKTWPANYVDKTEYSTAKNIFGDDTRCVSTYSRTDGYATAVPYQTGSGGTPLYHELDVAILNSYNSNNRGVGRVVVWEYGFNASGYDSHPVAVYTDDHYATFQEYLNDGSYVTRFNAEMRLTPYYWGEPITY